MDWLSHLRRKIRSGYLISFVLLLFSFCLIFYVQQRLLREYDWVVHSYVVLNNAEALKAEVTAAETGMRGYLITKDSQYLTPYKVALKSVPALCDQIKALTPDNADQHEKTKQIERLVKNRMDILSKGLATFQSNGFVVTDEIRKRLDTGLITMDSAKSEISDFRNTEEKLMQERKDRLSGFFNWAKWMAIISLIIVFVALLYSMITFNREFKKRVNADKTADKYRVDLESNKTELHEKNLELKKLRDLERFTSTGRIARTIAHEVRNPLTNILLATEQLKETESGNEDSPVLLDLINRNAARINQLVSDLLNATRFSHPWSHPDPEMDGLQARLAEISSRAAGSEEPADTVFARMAALAAPGWSLSVSGRRGANPRLTEDWFC